MVWGHSHDLSQPGQKGGHEHCSGSEITSFVEWEKMWKVWELFALLHSILKNQWVCFLKDCQRSQRDNVVV